MIIQPITRYLLQILILICLLVLSDTTLQAQAVRYEIEMVPNTKELVGFIGTSMLQDSDGFMWFSSIQGLCKYDGTNFYRYFYYPSRNKGSISDTIGLINDLVYSMIEDSKGILWLANYNALTRFDRKTETFKHFTDTLLSSPIECVLEDKDGCLWIGSQNGLSRFDKKTETFSYYTEYKSEGTGSLKTAVYQIYEDITGNLWLKHIFGRISVFNRETETFENIHNAPHVVYNFLEDRSGRFWIASQDGLYQYNRKSKTFQRYLYKPHDPNRLASQKIEEIIEDVTGNLWILTGIGIYQYNQNLEKLNFGIYPEENNVEKTDFTLPVGIRNLYADKTGTIWFFTSYGICKLIKRYNNFTIYKPVSTDNQSNISNIENNIFTSSWSYDGYQSHRGVYMLNKKTYTYTRLIVDPDNDIENFGFLIADRTGKLWVATKGSGLYWGIISENGTVKFESVFSNTNDSANVLDLFIHYLFEDSKGRIWINSKNHMPCFYDPEQDRIMHLVNNPESTDKLTVIEGNLPPELDYYFCSVQGETNSGILLAVNEVYGIFAIMPPFIRVSENAVAPTEIIRFRSETGEDMITGTHLYQSPHDSLGIIWTKTSVPQGKGFQKLVPVHDSKKNKFVYITRFYTIKDGLPSNQIKRFLEDDNGNFWLSIRNGGLSKFDPLNETFTNYDMKDGLPYILNADAAIKTEEGELIFGSGIAFISFYPDSIQFNNHVPPVKLTELKINQQSVSPWESTILDKLVTYSDHIDLSYNQNNISLGYAALNYVQSNRNQYKYKLEGFDHDWIYAGNRTNVNYTNLKPGRYTFRVSGSNNDGVWNKEGASLKIAIHSPPWKTAWAYFIYGFILIGMILWYRRFLLNRAKIRTALEVERVEKEKVQELDHMKSRFFANISHEFRTPLTLLLGPVEDLLKSKSDRDEKERGLFKLMHRNAKRLQLLINQLLDLSKLETGNVKLQVSEGDISEFIRAIVLSFLSLAESKSIGYQYDIADLPEKVYYDADKLEKILTNLISNAFKFTPANGKVSVSLQYVTSAEHGNSQYADIKVSDTGKGIADEQSKKIFDRFYQVSDSDTRDAEGTGIGLALTKELVDLYQGEISVESEIGKGSTFRVRLPVSRGQFKEEEIVTTTPGEEVMEKPVESELEQVDTERIEMKESQKQGKTNEAPVILLVEDNIDLSNYISRNLGNSYQVLTAENGKHGLELAIESIPDLIISDLMMPVMDGMEMCRHLKTDERTNHIPVVMLTARADRESRMEGLETGADDYIIKPFDAEELQVRVRNLIEQRKRLREKFSKEFISESSDKPYSPKDQFLNKLIGSLDKHVSEPEFTMEQLGKELYMSRAQVFRKVTAITGTTPNELLQMIRMKHAARLLLSSEFNVTQVMYEVGIRNPSYFAQIFRKYHGKNPSEYKRSKIPS